MTILGICLEQATYTPYHFISGGLFFHKTTSILILAAYKFNSLKQKKYPS